MAQTAKHLPALPLLYCPPSMFVTCPRATLGCALTFNLSLICSCLIKFQLLLFCLLLLLLLLLLCSLTPFKPNRQEIIPICRLSPLDQFNESVNFNEPQNCFYFHVLIEIIIIIITIATTTCTSCSRCQPSSLSPSLHLRVRV